MWSPHPLQGCEQYAHWNSACAEVWVEGTMRTQAANRRPSVGTPPSARSWEQASKAWSSPSGPRTKVRGGDAAIWA